MTDASPPLDTEKLQAKIRQVFGLMGGAVLSGMVYLGDRLGLYRAMAGAGPLDSAALAARTGLDERWVREWLRGQGAAGLLEHRGGERFELTPEGAVVLADESHPAFAAGGFAGLPAQMQVLERLPEAFRTGRGLPYDAFGEEGNRGVERSFAPWFRTLLVPLALPRLDGVVDKLRAGGEAADVGCGSGVAVIEMARAFPKSHFHGYELSRHCLDLAQHNRDEAGVENVSFHDVLTEPLPREPRFDLVTTFDCVHDMARPQAAIRAIRGALKEDGTWFLADIKSHETYEQNVERNPMAALMYGFSVMSCMSSALSEPGGAGLGTLGLHEKLARRMAAEAGFTRFRRVDLDHPVNAYYEIRP
jgi:2-polyprenyl-3-methyl-5-hydroxy-6-metoxy-1,4-benzoquinol methylase